MEGFFSMKETQSTSRPDGKLLSCTSCGLHQNCSTPKLSVPSSFNKRILNVGPHPSRLDDARKNTFQEKYYNFLKKEYKRIGVSLYDDCINTYSTICYSKETPTDYNIDCCRKELMKVIREYKPDIIVTFGIDALYSLIGNRWKKDFGGIDKWRGWIIPDQDLETWICPVEDVETLHKKDTINTLIFQQDLDRIAKLINNPELRTYKIPDIIDITGDLSPLDDIQNTTVAFDYETTGIKPHAIGHKIVCASVAISADTVYVFEMPASKKERLPFINLLQNETVGKIAQNMKFEDNWSNVRLKTEVKNWVWDTMLATHQLDNRTGITSLKFQTYVQFGIVDYDSEISPYLKSADTDGANSINRVEELLKTPSRKSQLLEYCALDSIYEYRLAALQMPQILAKPTRDNGVPPGFKDAYYLFHDGILALAKAERQGFRIDTDYITIQTIKLEKKINSLEKQIKESSFYKEWKASVGKAINLNSGKQLRDYLYGVKNIKPSKLTESGLGSTDVEALEVLNIPELDLLIRRQRLQKVKDTYLKAFEREQVKGILHPSFNLHIARTYRSSSQDPNFQNIPKRDKYAMQTVRKSIFPREGNQLFEVDYSGLEVSIAACYHNDPVMIKYLNDPSSDMHRDIAKEVFLLDTFDKTLPSHKLLRSATKNGFVFPEFYGDYYVNCANALSTKWVKLHDPVWKKGQGIEFEDGTFISDHFINKGIKGIADFTKHIEKLEKDFWGKRFSVYAQWKDTWYAMYKKYGYVPFKTGFRAVGAMSKNDVTNYPVQGAAFHCLMWTLIQIDKELELRGMQTKILGQIHDAIVFDVFPPELKTVWELVQKFGTVELPKAFTWINVPLSIEAEICAVDASWALKEDFHFDTYKFKPNILPF